MDEESVANINSNLLEAKKKHFMFSKLSYPFLLI